MTRARDISNVITDADLAGNIDVDGTANLDVVDIDGALTQDGGAVFNEDSADVDFRVESNGEANMLVVDGGNNAVVIGESAPDTSISGGTPAFQVIGSAFDSFMSLTRRVASASAPSLALTKSRNTSVGSHTIVQDGDTIGEINFFADDGTDLDSRVGTIKAQVDGTPGANDTPGKLIFMTTADGSNSPTERMRIMANGRLENQSPSNTGNVLQDFRIDFRNENNAGIMAGIGCVRTANANAPGAFVIRTSTDVDSSSNNSDGEISEKFRVAANGDLTATDTSISSNSDSRLKENISDFTYDLDKFKALKTKTFDWKNPKLHGEKSGQRGFVAQDVETVDSYWIEEIEVPADSDDFQYLEDKDIFYTKDCTIPEGKKVGDLEYKARFAKTSKLGQKDAMYVSVIQQLIKRIETLESK